MNENIANDLRQSAQWINEMEHESWFGTAELQLEAADEIERLRAREQDLRMHAEQDACEIERLRSAGDALQVLLRGRTAEFLAEIERLRSEQYVEDLGVDWCVLHHGVRNEDWDRCDAFDWADGDDMLDEDGEYLPCDVRPLAYREARRER